MVTLDSAKSNTLLFPHPVFQAVMSMLTDPIKDKVVCYPT